MVSKAGHSGCAQVAEGRAAEAQRSAAGREGDVHHCIIKMLPERACLGSVEKDKDWGPGGFKVGRVDADV